MNRRSFLKRAAMAITAAATAPHANAQNAEAAAHPNIIIILADDLGYGDVSCLNSNSKIQTPNIDRLAKAGMKFTNAHSPSGVCSPTRYGLLTGRYAWRTRLSQSVLWGYSPPLITQRRLTLPKLLKEKGYRTAGIGKWHLGLNWHSHDGEPVTERNVDFHNPITGGPTDLGFDSYYGIPASPDMEPYVYLDNDKLEEVPTQALGGRSGVAFYRSGPAAAGFSHIELMPRLTDKAINVIEDHSENHNDQPLFLYFPLTAPHLPLLPTKDFRGTTPIGPWGDFISQVDHTIGQIMDAIDKADKTNNTLFIVTSDNGATPNADLEAMAALGHNPSHHFRGCKADVYEGGHRIPFIARWPKKIKPNSTSDQTICLTDLLATVAAITGATLPGTAGEDSTNILPALLGQATEPLRQATVHHSIEGYYAIRQGKWKLLLCPGSGGWSYPTPRDTQALDRPPVQLYNLDEDIAEKNNLHEKHPDIVDRLTKLLQKYADEGRSTPGPQQKNDRTVSIWGPD
jgi:arylsulfatase A-like enzyme